MKTFYCAQLFFLVVGLLGVILSEMVHSLTDAGTESKDDLIKSEFDEEQDGLI